MLCRPYGAYHNPSLLRGLTPPPMLCRPKGLCHVSAHLPPFSGRAGEELILHSSLFTLHSYGVNTPAYAVSPLRLRGLTPPPMLYRPYGANHNSTLYTLHGAYAPRLCSIAPTGLIITLHSYGGLRTPPMLCRPYGANHNSTLYTLHSKLIILHSSLFTLN